VKLHTLLNNLKYKKIYGTDKLTVSGIADNSRKVKKGSLFVAIKGLTVDGHKYIPQAISQGAVVIVGQSFPQKSWLNKITYIQVANSREALGLLASAWYKNPSEKMKIIGITGTDGKTTTASLIHWILVTSGKKAGLVSTVEAKTGKQSHSTGLHVTNPEPLVLQKFLSKMVEEKCKYAVLEVTSHGIHQKRTAGIAFNIAVLTNITREHLDYHKTFSSYKKTKQELFKNAKISVLNKDDNSFSQFKKSLPKGSETITYAINSKANFRAEKLKISLQKTSFLVLSNGKNISFSSALTGKYNTYNILAAISVARHLNIPWKDIKKAVSTFKAPLGRMQRVKNRKKINIYIDFAHTPNALQKVLTFLRQNKKGKLIVITGAEGERDKSKRPLMGRIASEFADYSIFTAVDPRSEDVKDINNQMLAGVKKEKITRVYCIPDRTQAIKFAVQILAKPGDTVIVCGKGHEKSMNTEGKELPWSDLNTINQVLYPKLNLKNIKHIHFTGIKGVGMTSLALCAADMGIKITGSDVKEFFVTDETLSRRKIDWKVGFGKNNLKKLPDLLITTGAHGGLNNPEVQYARDKGVPVITHAEALGLFTKKKDTIAVCGVGGKTTTCSMIATILDTNHCHPSFAIGVGNIFPIDTPGKFSKKQGCFICEADEYAISPGIDMRPRFSYISPKILIVTNIEHDHPDIYPTFKDTKHTYRRFFERIPKDGHLIASSDCKNLTKIIADIDLPVQT